MKRILPTTLLCALVALLAVLSSSCVWGQRSPLAILAGAKDDALKTTTVHFTIETSFEGLDDPAQAEEFSFKAHGANDTKNGKHVIVLEAAGIEIEMRTVDGKSYMRMFGDTWTEMDADEADLGLFDADFDPFDLLDQLGVDDADVKHIGSGELHGKKAERFEIHLKSKDLDSSGLGMIMPPESDPVLEVWIDADGMPARLAYTFDLEAEEMDIENSGPVRFSLTLDLFDYGKPVDVDAPPADKIVDVPDLGSLGNLGGAMSDPFEGADCYGDKLEGCLQPDPKTDAMASNPDLCRGTAARVCLVPVGKVRPDVVQAILDFHRETKGIDVVVLPGLPVPMADLHEEDSQVTAEGLYRALQANYGASNSSASTFIAITSIDVVPEGGQYGWEFGARYGSGPYGNRHGVFSYFRMANVEPYDGKPLTDDLLHQRVAKYTARYTAILFLHSGTTEDIDYLNYFEMYGFSDLDEMGTKWPELKAQPCTGGHEVICLIPDGKYADPAFLTDLQAAADRLANQGFPVAIFEPQGVYFFPTSSDWGAEFTSDLSTYYKEWYEPDPSISVIGVTDNRFSEDASLAPSFESYRTPSQVAVVSVFDSSLTGTPQRQERVYRMLLRALLQSHYHMPLSEDPSSLLWNGATKPPDLDGKAIPALPK